jgi:hypothetical protein
MLTASIKHDNMYKRYILVSMVVCIEARMTIVVFAGHHYCDKETTIRLMTGIERVVRGEFLLTQGHEV